MSEEEFQAALLRWKGRPYVLAQLQSRGFAVHTHYDQIISDECPVRDKSDLDIYWNEMAREYVCSRGRVKSRAREFPDIICYRSKYLDDLALRQTDEPAFRRAMHPCVLAFELRRSKALLAPVFERLQSFKYEEILHHKIQRDFWTGSTTDIPSIFNDLMSEKGFKRKRRAYVKEDQNGLIFSGRIDLGGRPFVVGVPFRLSIAHRRTEAKEEVFDFWVRRVVEGLDAYKTYQGVEAGALGFKAYVEMFDIMSESFSEI